MFNRKKAAPRPAVNGFSSLIADNLSVQGDLEFSDGLKVDGRIRGRVSFKPGTTSLLAVSVNGVVEGDVSSYDALIDGTIIGDLRVEHLLELHSNARVSGNITYRQLSMENGAVVEGTLRRLDEGAAVLELPQPAAALLPQSPEASERS
ncbi:bactofilin family protein [Pseudomonas oryzihabitans]|uniref:Cytoskeletal protein CcmA (Bactofilin family) n=1 Tax=Pseudomonas oryzihabitans TaxID=47885 RepID=A0AAJ2BKT8_9PSED|nr:polymer-forming cytoskeletal protein [Pseudomonas psychrotolerans]MDR6234407.1 cytoskeletal protein CcmA (bactofilin family) [Pseudomonas psychrotolerans]MDR6356468.1 cytoskeletal protein CcmA (bactofilin family) [Pseudomonas psychrotolerans]MDR6676822.1 cytoskeletal protein CcmA (bactofilin family) [Pseudomonas psychrotolerans]QDD90491.1 cell shape determination protein CcmA [Pseudomonas psychrotolerans]